MRTPYRTTLAECREAMRPFLDLCRFETKQGRLNNSAGILDGSIWRWETTTYSVETNTSGAYG